MFLKLSVWRTGSQGSSMKCRSHVLCGVHLLAPPIQGGIWPMTGAAGTCARNRPRKREKEREKEYLDICMYMYIYMRCRVKSWSKICSIFRSKTGPSFLFLFLVLSSSFCKGNVKNWSHYGAQHAWTNFLAYAWTNFRLLCLDNCFVFFAEATIVVFSGQICISSPPPKIRNTVCEHNCAN